jgi:hypothetical protein
MSAKRLEWADGGERRTINRHDGSSAAPGESVPSSRMSEKMLEV